MNLDKFNAALANIPEQQAGILTVSVLMVAITALIRAHPQPDEVRRCFDEIFTTVQTGLLGYGSVEGRAFYHQLIDLLFSPSTT
jgi:hypothetical protein